MAIGYNWAEGSYANTSWVTGAWGVFATVYTVTLARIQAIIGYTRTQIVT